MTTAKKLPTRKLGENGPQVPRLGLGFVSFAGTYGSPGTDAERLALLDEAYKMGETFWDTGIALDLLRPTSELIHHQPMNMATQKTSSASGLLPIPKSGRTSSSARSLVFRTLTVRTSIDSASIPHLNTA